MNISSLYTVTLYQHYTFSWGQVKLTGGGGGRRWFSLTRFCHTLRQHNFCNYVLIHICDVGVTMYWRLLVHLIGIFVIASKNQIECKLNFCIEQALLTAISYDLLQNNIICKIASFPSGIGELFSFLFDLVDASRSSNTLLPPLATTEDCLTSAAVLVTRCLSSIVGVLTPGCLCFK